MKFYLAPVLSAFFMFSLQSSCFTKNKVRLVITGGIMSLASIELYKYVNKNHPNLVEKAQNFIEEYSELLFCFCNGWRSWSH